MEKTALEQHIADMTPFWRKQNITKAEIATIKTIEQAKWFDERGNQEIWNNNMQRS